MTHYDISYKGMDLESAADRAKAIADIKEYLSESQWTILMQGIAEGVGVRHIEIGLSIAGISGWPVFAFLREHFPDTYQPWFDALPDE